MPRITPRPGLVTAVAVATLACGWTLDSLRQRRRLRAARLDPLTGLPDRDDLAARAQQLAATHPDTAALLLDANGFKSLNDTHGHAAGDALLAALADRFRAWCAQHGGHAARLGGDEFAAAVPLPVDRDTAHRVLADLHHTLTRPVPYEQQVLPVSVAIGAAYLADAPGRAWDTALRAADTAMYAAKQAARTGPGLPVLASGDEAPAPSVNGRRAGRPGAAWPVPVESRTEPAVPLDILVGPENAAAFITARVRDLVTQDLLPEPVAYRVVCEAATDGDPWTLADAGQVWTLPPDADPADYPADYLYVVRRHGAEITAEDVHGTRDVLPVDVLADYRIDHWWWTR